MTFNRTFLLLSIMLICTPAYGSGILSPGDTLWIEPETVPSRWLQEYGLPLMETRHPQVALALSGGGARGLAHVGVIEELIAAGIPIDLIAGTSIGAFVGALYAVGYDIAQVDSMIQQISWGSLYHDRPKREYMFPSSGLHSTDHLLQLRFRDYTPYFPSSVVSGQTYSDLLSQLLRNGTYPSSGSFNLLRVPLRVVATDLISGSRVVIDQGDLAVAVRASSSMPLMLKPVPRDSMLLVDGGLVENIPVQTAWEMGADFVIAVDATTTLRTREELQQPWEVVDQISSFNIDIQNRLLREKASFVIRPDILEFGTIDFDAAADIIQRGRMAARTVIDSLRLQIQAQSGSGDQRTLFIDQIRILNPTGKALPESISPGRHTVQDISDWLSRQHDSGDYQHERAACFRNETGEQILQVELTPWPQINAFHIHGIPREDSLRLVNLLLDQDLQYPNIRKNQEIWREAIREFRTQGYSLANLDSISLQNDEVHLWIDMGVIDEVGIIGIEQTSRRNALRDFNIKPGDLFQIKRMQKSVDNLYGSQLYESVYYRIEEREHRRRVDLMVSENQFPLLQLATAYDDRTFQRFYVRLKDENSLGLGIRTLLYWKYSHPHRILELQLEQDRLLGTSYTWSVKATNTYERFHDWNRFECGVPVVHKSLALNVSAGRQIRRLGTIHIGMFFVSAEYGYQGRPTRSHDLRGIRISSLVDTRNLLTYPTSGEYHLVQIDMVPSLGNPSQSFNRWSGRFMSWRTLKRNHTFHSRIYWGHADEATPPYSFYYLDQTNSVPTLMPREYRGRVVTQLGLEYQLSLYQRDYMRSFLSLAVDDLGHWESSYSRFDLDQTQLFVTGGLVVVSPAGPLALHISHKPRDTVSGHLTRYSINLGFHF